MVQLVREETNGYTIEHNGEGVTDVATTTIADSYLIRAGDETVGYIQVTNNTIVQIEVFDEGNGYGTAALANLMELFEQSEYDSVTTTTVISSAFEAILLDYGFEPTEGPTDNSYQYSFDD